MRIAVTMFIAQCSSLNPVAKAFVVRFVRGNSCAFVHLFQFEEYQTTRPLTQHNHPEKRMVYSTRMFRIYLICTVRTLTVQHTVQDDITVLQVHKSAWLSRGQLLIPATTSSCELKCWWPSQESRKKIKKEMLEREGYILSWPNEFCLVVEFGRLLVWHDCISLM